MNVGSNCVVKGMVSLCSSVGDGAQVEKLSVVPEGAMVPEQARARGNPAFVSTIGTDTFQTLQHENKYVYLLGFFKIVWLVIELYMFFGALLLGQ